MRKDNDSKSYPPVGCCIYCGATEGKLTKEHIIPFGLGGKWVLPKSSCMECSKVTSEFERFVQRNMLGPLRIHLKLPTRRPDERPDHLPIELIRVDGVRETEMIPAEEFPHSCIGFRFPTPGLLCGIEATENYDSGEIVVRLNRLNDENNTKYMTPDGQRAKLGQICILSFCRMLAKIAHSYAFAKFGAASFNPLLPDLILGKSAFAPYLVGGDNVIPVPDTQQFTHELYRHDYSVNGVHYMVIAIRLFAFIGMPRYHVVVGEALDG